MKKLNSSARLKKRYLSLGPVSREQAEKAILDYIGILGYAKAAPNFIGGKNITIAIDRAAINEVRAALEAAGIKVMHVSGTLKGLEKKS